MFHKESVAMTLFQLLLRNLRFYWRTNLAVICGVVAATAVISGALVVGDSVRDSLKQMSLDRLGRIDFVLQGMRFFREELADELQQAAPAAEQVAPVVMMQGTLEFQRDKQSVARASQINLYGVDHRLWELIDHGAFEPPRPGQVVVNRRVADQLGVSPGDRLSLIVEIPPFIPRDSLLGERNEVVTELDLTLTGIAEDETGIARLGLNPTQQLPANAFINLSELQSQVGLSAIEKSRRNAFAKPARVNALMISTSAAALPAPSLISRNTGKELDAALGRLLRLEDLELRLLEHPDHGYLSLESEQMFLEAAVSKAALAAGQELRGETSPVLVSLVNEIRKQRNPERYSMYSVIAGIRPEEPKPFGPLEFLGDHQPLEGDRVYLNEWLAQDLEAKVGDRIMVKYHVVGDRGDLPEEEREFEVGGIVKLTGPADDQGYTPTVPGVTDADSYDDWREPFPLKKQLITSRDDAYWDAYRTTPKLFISLSRAQELWPSRYGNLTSVRIAPPPGESLDQFRSRFEKSFLAKLNPKELGLSMQPVKLLGLQAAQGTTDFTGLFIGFSFFLIVSAALLAGLLFRLGIERRLAEIGLLSSVGLAMRQIGRLLLAEGIVLVAVGAALGTVAAIGYAAVMVHGLKTWWYGAIGTRFLHLSIHALSLLIGAAIAIVVALGTIWWSVRRTRSQSARSLLNGQTCESMPSSRAWMARGLAASALSISLGLLMATLAGLIPDVEAFGGFSWKIVLFFLVGIGFLTGMLASLSVILTANQSITLQGGPTRGTLALGFKNAARNRSRSVSTISLIASATFVITAVAAGQMNPLGDKPDRHSGNGGFTLVAQCSVPILYDLNTPSGRARLGFNVLDEKQMALLDRATVFPFRRKSGENASCLNLYQTQLPTVLGVPADVLDQLIEQERFVFADTPSRQPWTLLRQKLPDGRIPVLGDMNTLMYSLHKGIGATINVPNDEQPKQTLEVAGMFANSIFQGVLVMSEENFLKIFPEQAGFGYFLIDVDPAQASDVARLLESSLGDYGFDVDRVSKRLADFLSVQNTYLSTFQALGGLGLLLGTLGLSTMMLRNVLERAGELALLQAVGFRKSQVAWLVVWENALLLACGLLTGTVSALLAMAPHLSSTVSDTPWPSLLGMLAAVFAIGMLAAVMAIRAAVSLPILTTLRSE
jgi:ABC-type antimicrobial peptide transport system permease subunit